MRRKEKKHRLSLLAKFMVLLMIVNLFSVISPMAVRAASEPDNAYWKPGSVTKDVFTIEKEVTDYSSEDGTYGIRMTVKVSDDAVPDTGTLLIKNGIITDNMTKFVEYMENSVVLSGKKEGVEPNFIDSNIISIPPKLEISKINLGRGESLEVTYRVKLEERWQDGEFYPTNGDTILRIFRDTQIPDNGTTMNFKIPEIKYLATNKLTVKKVWEDTDKNSETDVFFEVLDGGDRLVTGKIEKGKYETTIDVPKYRNGDNIPGYGVRELDETGKGIEEDKEAIIGGSKFKVNYPESNEDNIFIITNTFIDNKIKIDIYKEWGKGVPDIAKKSVKVIVKEKDNKIEPKEIALAPDGEGNWGTTVLVPKYKDGENLNYFVLETEINGEKIVIPESIKPDPVTGDGYYYHKAFKITLKGFKDITQNTKVLITNSIREPESNDDYDVIDVVKDWGKTAESYKATVRVKLYKFNAEGKLEEVKLEDKANPEELDLTKESGWQGQFRIPIKKNIINSLPIKNRVIAMKDPTTKILHNVVALMEVSEYIVLETKVGENEIDKAKLDELLSNPALIKDGYKIGDYQVKIDKLVHYVPNENDLVLSYGFYIMNEGKQTNDDNGGGPIIPDPVPSPDTSTDSNSTTPTDSAVDVPTDSTPQGTTDTVVDSTDKNTEENTDDTGIAEDIEEVEDDDVPEGAMQDEVVDVAKDTTPKGSTGLPRTGGVPAEVFGLIGFGVIGLGLIIKKRK